MKKGLYIALLITLLLTVEMNLFGQSAEKILKVLSKEMKVSKSDIELVDREIPAELEGKVEAVYTYKLNGEKQGYVILAKGMGRYDEFSFFLLSGSDHSTQMVRVVNYISDHGGEISSKKWLQQFEGYKGGELKYGDDIQAISGATLSAGSITNRVHEIVGLLNQTDL